jgi:hypothetical protein
MLAYYEGNANEARQMAELGLETQPRDSPPPRAQGVTGVPGRKFRDRAGGDRPAQRGGCERAAAWPDRRARRPRRRHPRRRAHREHRRGARPRPRHRQTGARLVTAYSDRPQIRQQRPRHDRRPLGKHRRRREALRDARSARGTASFQVGLSFDRLLGLLAATLGRADAALDLRSFGLSGARAPTIQPAAFANTGHRLAHAPARRRRASCGTAKIQLLPSLTCGSRRPYEWRLGSTSTGTLVAFPDSP